MRAPLIVAFAVLACGACMVPEEALSLERQSPDEAGIAVWAHYPGFALAPDAVATPTISNAETHFRSLGLPGARKQRGQWSVMRDVAFYREDWDPQTDPCATNPPRFPAISADGRVLALGLGAGDARSLHATVHLIATEDGTVIGRHDLPRHDYDGTYSPRQTCGDIEALAAFLAPGGFEAMPVVGVWDGVESPRHVSPWMHVASDGATREDSGGNDVLVVPARALGREPLLQVQAPSAEPPYGNVWASGRVAVVTRYHVGC